MKLNVVAVVVGHLGSVWLVVGYRGASWEELRWDRDSVNALEAKLLNWMWKTVVVSVKRPFHSVKFIW